MMKKSCVDSWDVNTAFMLSDTSPVVGASTPQYMTFSEEKICCEVVSANDLILLKFDFLVNFISMLCHILM